MPTDAFLTAAAAGTRSPVAFVTIEGIGAQSFGCDQRAEWLEAKAMSDTCNLDDVLNAVTLRDALPMTKDTIDGGEFVGNVYVWRAVPRLSATDLLINSVDLGFRRGTTLPYSTPVSARILINNANNLGDVIASPLKVFTPDYFTPIPGYQMNYNGFTSAVFNAFDPDNSPFATFPASAIFHIRIPNSTYAIDDGITGINSITAAYASGSIQTQTIDLGALPADPPLFTVSDDQPPGTAITYTARGSSNASDWVDLGAVVDGDLLDPYRYYDVTATLTSSNGRTPRLDAIMLRLGDYEFLSTHAGIPTSRARGLIKEGGISSLSTKLDLTKPATVGELSIKLHMNRDTSNLIGAGIMKGKVVTCALGYVGLAASDYQPYFAGIWNDWSYDHTDRVATVKVRDGWKRLKNKVPRESFDGAGVRNLTPLTISAGTNVMSAMLTVIDAAGLPARMINTASFTDLAAGARSGANWTVGRTISKPEPAETLLNQLATIAGVFIIPDPSGRISAQLYDPAATPVADLDNRYCNFSPVEGGQKELKTRQIIYYDLVTGADGSSRDDYDKGHLLVDTATEADYEGEVQEMEYLEPWGATLYAIEALATRRAAWFIAPKLTLKASNIAPRYLGVITLGAIVSVTGLTLPVPTASLPTSGLYTTSAKPFLVVGINIDPRSMSLGCDLLEV